MKPFLRFRKVSIGLFAALVLLASTVLVTLISGTPAPSKKSVDYLEIIRSLAPVQDRVELQLSTSQPAAVPRITDAEFQHAREKSNGKIRRLELRSDGAIFVVTTISGTESDTTEGVLVKLLLVPTKVGQKYDWRCFGDPLARLPSFCKQLA